MVTTTDYTTNPEYTSLLRRILESPEDDAPRLIISDWIEEHGDQERAEFIRSMVAVWNHDGQGLAGTLTYEQMEHHDAIIEKWFSNREWGPYLEKLFGWNWSRRNCCEWRQWDMRRDVQSVWSRGFISEIRLTCAEFVGRQCDACKGSGRLAFPDAGRLNSSPYFVACEPCHGTGHIEGVARELFERHPITSVVLVDKRPTSGWWIFVKPGDRDYGRISDTLPVELIHPMSDICHKNPFVGGVSGHYTNAARFADESVAQQALNRACVAYGRSLAELPELKLPTTAHA